MENTDEKKSEQASSNISDKRPDKKVHIVSLGCPKNLVDSEMMLGGLVKDGYSVTNNPAEADTLIVNTCGFIEDAKRESISKVLELAEIKGDDKSKKLVVAGCLTQRYKDELVEGLPEADLFVGSGEFQNIPEILRGDTAEQNGGSNSGDDSVKLSARAEQVSLKKDFFNRPTFLQKKDTPRINSGPFYRAYLKISEGCKKRCAFCSIPHIRGNLQSRSIPDVVAEAKLLVASGVQEIIVISHDFTDYGWDLRKQDKARVENPHELLKALAEVEGLRWIRVLYLYPDGVNQELIDLMKENTNLVRYFDMPLQHINNEVLKKMNRRMTREMIEEAIGLIRSELPDAVIRTQFIVGFPGETEDQFQELKAFIKEQKFDRVGCFKYSVEEGTKAGAMDDQVDEETKQRRHDELMELQKDISKDIHEKYVGQRLTVVVEGESEESELLLQGRFSQQSPEIDGVVYINDGTANVGDFVEVEITESLDYDLVGSIVSRNATS